MINLLRPTRLFTVTPGLISGWDDTVGLNPAHVECQRDEQESDNRQCNTDGEELDRAVGISTVLDQAEHAGAKAEYDQTE